MEKAKNIGTTAYEAELNEKIKILKHLLENYNDGRKKSLFCLAVNLLDLQDLNAIMKQLAGTTATETPIKEKAATAAKLFNESAEKKGITLKLRK